MATESLLGQFPQHWKLTTLGEACKHDGGNIQTGPFGSQLHASDYTAVGIPSIMPQNIGDNRVITDQIARISSQDANRLSRYCVHVGDIVYSRRGDVERRALIRAEEDGWLCGTGCLRIRFGYGAVDPLFASYYLGHPNVREWIVRHAVGATMPNLNTSILAALPLVIPPLPEQRAIAHILGSLDDKIELNRRMNETLESITQTLFKSWFVAFDPVHAKMEGRQSFGMDAETAALFPNEFEDSQIGEIPINWKLIKLGEAVDINKSSVMKDWAEKEIEYIDISSVSKGKLEATTRYLLSDAPSRARRLIRHGDTIWSTVRPNRKSYLFIHSPQENFVVSTGFAVLTPHLIPTTYLYQWVTTDQFVDYLSYNADGSAYPAVNSSRFAEALLLLPSSKVLQKFEEFAFPIRTLIHQNEKASSTLVSIRDELLPKLLSGEIRVKEAEKVAEEVL